MHSYFSGLYISQLMLNWWDAGLSWLVVFVFLVYVTGNGNRPCRGKYSSSALHRINRWNCKSQTINKSTEPFRPYTCILNCFKPHSYPLIHFSLFHTFLLFFNKKVAVNEKYVYLHMNPPPILFFNPYKYIQVHSECLVDYDDAVFMATIHLFLNFGEIATRKDLRWLLYCQSTYLCFKVKFAN